MVSLRDKLGHVFFFLFFFSLCLPYKHIYKLTQLFSVSPGALWWWDCGVLWNLLCGCCIVSPLSLLTVSRRPGVEEGWAPMCVCLRLCVCWHGASLMTFIWMTDAELWTERKIYRKTATSTTLRKSFSNWYGFKENQTDLGLSVNDH